MCHFFILDSKGKIHYGVLILFVTVIILLFAVLVEKRTLINLHDRVDNEMAVALISGGIFSLERLYDSFVPVKSIDNSEVLYDFEATYEALDIYVEPYAAKVLAGKVLMENLKQDSLGANLINDIKISEFVVKNSKEISTNVIPNVLDESEYTGIYMQIQLEFGDFFGINRKCYLDKSIYLKY